MERRLHFPLRPYLKPWLNCHRPVAEYPHGWKCVESAESAPRLDRHGDACGFPRSHCSVVPAQGSQSAEAAFLADVSRGICTTGQQPGLPPCRAARHVLRPVRNGGLAASCREDCRPRHCATARHCGGLRSFLKNLHVRDRDSTALKRSARAASPRRLNSRLQSRAALLQRKHFQFRS